MGERLVKAGEIEQAEALKEQGITRSIDHAERDNPGWKDCAWQYLLAFIDNKKREIKEGRLILPFLGEDIRCYAAAWGLPEPPSSRAWGAVIRRAQKEGLIRFCGYAKTTNPKAHRTPAAQWLPGTSLREWATQKPGF